MTTIDQDALAPPGVLSASAARPARAANPALARTLRAYTRMLVATDLAAVSAAVVGGMGLDLANLAWSAERFAASGGLGLAAALAAGWMWALSFMRSRDRRILGAGSQEFGSVGNATWWTFALVAVASFVLDLDAARTHAAATFPMGLAFLLAGRYAWRKRLQAERNDGGALASVLVVVTRENARDLIRTFAKSPQICYGVAGICVPPGEDETDVLGVPVVGSPEDAARLAAELIADVVAVAGSNAMTADYVRSLGWALNPQGIGLMVSGALADVAGPRLVVSPVTGARLVHVDAPVFTGPKYVVKTVLDSLTASAAIVVLAPVFAAIAVAVRLDSPGPAFFQQVRVGRNGKTFRMYKFRSMDTGADTRVADLVRQDDGNGLLFKMKDDPRVTPVGRFLRRTSLDELPQLFNVAKGDMSLVGPRPPLEREVARYDGAISRRLLVKPGITGPWQVSGRSDLPLDESLRYDLNYVENWSLVGDLAILARTVKAVAKGTGAY